MRINVAGQDDFRLSIKPQGDEGTLRQKECCRAIDFPEDLSKPVALADSANTRITTSSSGSRSDLFQLRNSELNSVET